MQNRDAKPFEGFWCNFHMSSEERADYKRNEQPLFKIKRAIIESTNMDASDIIVKK